LAGLLLLNPLQVPPPAVFVDKNTKVICQGLTGKNGTFHTEQVCSCRLDRPARGLVAAQVGDSGGALPLLVVLSCGCRCCRWCFWCCCNEWW
jgi:hypothetical protein